MRKGYRPVEIPVNYRSRSFKEGKKVSMFRDPLTWLLAIIKLRLTKVDPLAEIERQNPPSPINVSTPAAQISGVPEQKNASLKSI